MIVEILADRSYSESVSGAQLLDQLALIVGSRQRSDETQFVFERRSSLQASQAQAVARTVKEGGEYLEGVKVSGMAEGAARLIRQNPIPAILIAIGVGWYVGRKLGN